jgi:large subunit ribosomal protein L29
MASAAEISEYDVEELETRLDETRRELFNLRFQMATGQLDNFSRLGSVRKDIARMLTELRNREIAEAEGLAVDQIPSHQAAARQRTEDKALGRIRTTAGQRKAAAVAETAAKAETEVKADAAVDAPEDEDVVVDAVDEGTSDDGASDEKDES